MRGLPSLGAIYGWISAADNFDDAPGGHVERKLPRLRQRSFPVSSLLERAPSRSANIGLTLFTAQPLPAKPLDPEGGRSDVISLLMEITVTYSTPRHAGHEPRESMRRFPAAFYLAAMLFSVIASAPTELRADNSPIEIKDAWSRPTLGANRTGVAYLTVVNRSGTDDKLVSVSSPVAGTSEVHQTLEENGVMKMRPAPDLTIKAGATMVFKPGSYHIMFLDMARALKLGETFPLTLTFARAGVVQATVTVADQPAGGMQDMKM